MDMGDDALAMEKIVAAATADDDWETTAVPTVLRRPTTSTTTAAAGAGVSALQTGTEDDELAAETATAAFRSLRLVPPAPTQDGGVFDRGDPFRLTPNHQRQHALFDPNGTYEQPVSPATATAAVARYGPLDPVLLAGLENPRERLTLLKLEDQIVRFIRNPRETQLSFPPLSSYHRLIVHRLADRCCLEHQTAELQGNYGQGGGYDSNASRVVTLFKTPQTGVPRVLLIDLSADRQQPAVTPAAAPKIMIRKRAAPRGGAANGAAGGRGRGDGKNTQRSIEDRERAYAEARARIFGEDSGDNSSCAGDGRSFDQPAAASTATGVDGSRGGGRGSGTASGNPGRSTTELRSATRSQDAKRSTPTSERTPSPAAKQSESGFKPQHNWKESKVLWRNREQELNDPDFTRNHDAYRPSREPSYNARYGGHAGYQGAGYYADRDQRSHGGNYGHHGGFGGGRVARGPPGDFTRIDTAAPGRSPPPPSDYYRGSMNPPPPPPGGSYASSSAFSPHGRHFAPPPPPLPGHHQPQPRHPGAYNDDFPPLGK